MDIKISCVLKIIQVLPHFASNMYERIVNIQWVFGGCSSEKCVTVYFLFVTKKDTVTLAPVNGVITTSLNYYI